MTTDLVASDREEASKQRDNNNKIFVGPYNHVISGYEAVLRWRMRT